MRNRFTIPSFRTLAITGQIMIKYICIRVLFRGPLRLDQRFQPARLPVWNIMLYAGAVMFQMVDKQRGQMTSRAPET